MTKKQKLNWWELCLCRDLDGLEETNMYNVFENEGIGQNVPFLLKEWLQHFWPTTNKMKGNNILKKARFRNFALWNGLSVEACQHVCLHVYMTHYDANHPCSSVQNTKRKLMGLHFQLVLLFMDSVFLDDTVA